MKKEIKLWHEVNNIHNIQINDRYSMQSKIKFFSNLISRINRFTSNMLQLQSFILKNETTYRDCNIVINQPIVRLIRNTVKNLRWSLELFGKIGF